MTLIANALTTLARQKAYLEITSTSKDTLLSVIIGAVSEYIQKTYCHRTFKRTAYTNELYSGQDNESLYLKNFPVISGQTFTLQYRASGFNDGDWETIDSDHYFIDYNTGKITLVGGFVQGTQNYRVSYTAGYYLPTAVTGYSEGADTSLPVDIEYATWVIVANSFNKRKSRGVSSESVRDVSVTYLKTITEDAEIKAILDKYRRRGYR